MNMIDDYDLWLMIMIDDYDLWLMIMISQHPPLGGSKASGGKFSKKTPFFLNFLQNTKTAQTDFLMDFAHP